MRSTLEDVRSMEGLGIAAGTTRFRELGMPVLRAFAMDTKNRIVTRSLRPELNAVGLQLKRVGFSLPVCKQLRAL